MKLLDRNILYIVIVGLIVCPIVSAILLNDLEISTLILCCGLIYAFLGVILIVTFSLTLSKWDVRKNLYTTHVFGTFSRYRPAYKRKPAIYTFQYLIHGELITARTRITDAFLDEKDLGNVYDVWYNPDHNRQFVVAKNPNHTIQYMKYRDSFIFGMALLGIGVLCIVLFILIS